MDQVRHLLVRMRWRWRETHPLGSLRHSRVINWLYVDSVSAEQRVRHCLAVNRAADHNRDDVAWVVHNGQLLRLERSLECPNPLLVARALAFKWRTEASAPATIAGASEVVKMNPEANDRIASQRSREPAM